MTKEELDFIGSMNMCDEISNEAYEKIVCHAEETIVSDDCVSRAEALSGIRNLYPGTPIVRLNLKKWQEQNKKYFECEDIIKALPPVTPTRKSGLHWIERFDNKYVWLECPHCHKDSDNAYNYCPNCGASFKES